MDYVKGGTMQKQSPSCSTTSIAQGGVPAACRYTIIEYTKNDGRCPAFCRWAGKIFFACCSAQHAQAVQQRFQADQDQHDAAGTLGQCAELCAKHRADLDADGRADKGGHAD